MREWQSLEQVEHTNPVSVKLEKLLSLGAFRHQLLHAVCLGPLNPASHSRLPSSAVFRGAFPCVDVHFSISHVTLACVFVAEGGTTSSSGTVGELTVEQVFEDAAVIHTTHMAKPPQGALS